MQAIKTVARGDKERGGGKNTSNMPVSVQNGAQLRYVGRLMLAGQAAVVAAGSRETRK